jgi:hypothetical protein
MTLPTPPTARDWGLSWLRTAVPVAWGFIVTWIATYIPAVHGLLTRPEVYAAVDAAVTAVWYGLFRWIELHLPAWLTRFVLGANTAPVYPIVVEGKWEDVG